jgi:hypothetical protein
MTIRMHVEHLALEGLAVSGADRARLERAVVAELTRLLGGADAARALAGDLGGGAVASLPAAEVRLRPGDSAATLGAQVARSVYGALVPASAPEPRGAVEAPRAPGPGAAR